MVRIKMVPILAFAAVTQSAVLDKGHVLLEHANTTAQLQSLLTEYNLPALGVSADDGTGFRQSQLGVRKLGTSEAVGADALWHLGSNTKAMTATVIALLVQEGLVSWNSTLEEVFGTTHPDVHENARNVTVKELSSHRSGISGTFGLEPGLPAYIQLSMYKLDPVVGRSMAVSNIIGNSPLGLQLWSTRGEYEYSNNNYVLLGGIIDILTKEQAEEVIKSRIWEPLGMSSAGWGLMPVSSPWPHLPNITNLLPYPYPDDWPTELRDLPSFLGPAGLSHMSMEDYNKWLRLHVDPAAQTLVGLEVEQLEMLHTAPPVTRPQDRSYTYGGWVRYTGNECSEPPIKDSFCLFHTGSNMMNVAQGLVDTGRNLTISAMSNCPNVGGGLNGTMEGLRMIKNGTLVL